MGGSLEGQVAVVVGGASPVGRGLAVGLADRGAAVAVVGPGPVEDVAAEIEAGGGRAVAVAAAWDTREAAEGALTAASDSLGPIDVVVHALAEPEAYVPVDLMDLDEEAWARTAEEPVWSTLLTFQAAHSQFAGRAAGTGGRIFAVVPTASMSSAPHLVAATAAGDGQRSLVKASARHWGPAGITVNCIAVPIAFYSEAAADRPGLPGAALPMPSLRNEVAGLVATLCGPDAGAVTGATLAVDGGVWMTP